jgi:hypothetical protein
MGALLLLAAFMVTWLVGLIVVIWVVPALLVAALASTANERKTRPDMQQTPLR